MNRSHRDVATPPFRIVSFAAIVLALLWGVYLQNQVLLGSDLGWLIRSVRLMFEGQRFGVDIFEPNLPIVWYLCMPAALAVEHLGLSEVAAIRAWIWILAGVALLVTRACILQSGDRSRRILLELTVAAFAGCVIAGASFGQREHLALLLSLPYLFTARLRCAGTETQPSGAVMAGVLAGIAFSIKPVFLLVPLCVELSGLAVRRAQWRLVRLETVTMAIAGSLGFGISVALSPGYLQLVVPVTWATYWAYDVPLNDLLRDYSVALAVLAGWFVALSLDHRIWQASTTWFAAFCAWTASYFIQGRGFDYHAYPAGASALMVSVGALALLEARFQEAGAGSFLEKVGRWSTAKSVVAAAVILMTSMSLVLNTHVWFRAATDLDWPLSRPASRTELFNALRSAGVTEGKSVFTFSTHPFPAFPTLNYLGADWVGPDMAQFLLPAWLRKNEVMDPARLAAIEAAMTVQRRHVHTAVVEGRPDYILVNSWSRIGSPSAAGIKRIDYFATFGTDPALAEAFNRYVEIAESRGIRIYVRKD